MDLSGGQFQEFISGIFRNINYNFLQKSTIQISKNCVEIVLLELHSFYCTDTDLCFLKSSMLNFPLCWNILRYRVIRKHRAMID